MLESLGAVMANTSLTLFHHHLHSVVGCLNADSCGERISNDQCSLSRSRLVIWHMARNESRTLGDCLVCVQHIIDWNVWKLLYNLFSQARQARAATN